MVLPSSSQATAGALCRDIEAEGASWAGRQMLTPLAWTFAIDIWYRLNPQLGTSFYADTADILFVLSLCAIIGAAVGLVIWSVLSSPQLPRVRMRRGDRRCGDRRDCPRSRDRLDQQMEATIDRLSRAGRGLCRAHDPHRQRPLETKPDLQGSRRVGIGNGHARDWPPTPGCPSDPIRRTRPKFVPTSLMSKYHR